MRCPRLMALMTVAIVALAGGHAGPAAAQSGPAPLTQEPPPPLKPGEPVPAARQPGDVFGETVTLPARTIVYLKGQSGWEGAFDALRAAFKTLHGALDKAGIKPAGPALVVYTDTDDKGFTFEAALPVAEAPKAPLPAGVSSGPAPAGKALKFVHRGSYDAMDTTYDTITEYLDEQNLDATDPFVEEYVTDPLTTPADQLTVNIYVPVK